MARTLYHFTVGTPLPGSVQKAPNVWENLGQASKMTVKDNPSSGEIWTNESADMLTAERISGTIFLTQGDTFVFVPEGTLLVVHSGTSTSMVPISPVTGLGGNGVLDEILIDAKEQTIILDEIQDGLFNAPSGAASIYGILEISGTGDTIVAVQNTELDKKIFATIEISVANDTNSATGGIILAASYDPDGAVTGGTVLTGHLDIRGGVASEVTLNPTAGFPTLIQIQKAYVGANGGAAGNIAYALPMDPGGAMDPGDMVIFEVIPSSEIDEYSITVKLREDT